MNTEIGCWKVHCGADCIPLADKNQLPSSNVESNLVILRIEVVGFYETSEQNHYTTGCSDPEYPQFKPEYISFDLDYNVMKGTEYFMSL
jgi:hypothetical protein